MRREPIDRLLSPVNRLFAHESTTGILLLVMVVIAMVWENSTWGPSYHHLWETHFAVGLPGFSLDQSLHHWINDGLMAIFFFAVGLEIKREVISGELSTWKQASLPVAAALGGMVIPALIYTAFNQGGDGATGWGIPMATDIAFTLGLISIVGSRVPLALKIFITALATVDDIGAVLVIAFFYTPEVDLLTLAVAAGCLLTMLGGNFLGIRTVWFYLFFGVLGLWTGMLLSGVHATLAGVLAALAIPARVKVEEQEYQGLLAEWTQRFSQSPSIGGPLISEHQLEIAREVVRGSLHATPPLQRLEHALSPLVSFFVMPVFALANAGVSLEGNLVALVTHPVSLGIIAGLVVGKIVGILAFSRFMTRTGLGQLPRGSTWNHLGGIGMMAGIGFTMSLFIAELAFTDEVLIRHAKIGVLTASTLSALIGLTWLRFFSPPVRADEEEAIATEMMEEYAE